MTQRLHIKSATTVVSVDKSKREIEKMLRRYGCSKLQVTEDYGAGIFSVAFALPDEAGASGHVPVKIEIEVAKVHHALRRNSTRSVNLEQAQRVAWRQLVLWLDAALSASTLGLQRISEAFFAHILVNGSERMIDVVTQHADEIGMPALRLLKSGTDA